MDIASARNDKSDALTAASQDGPATAAPTPRRIEGRVARYVFSASVIIGIIFAAYAFLWLIGRSTNQTGSRLDLPQRTAEQIFIEAERIEIKSLRLRALRNFTAAYPDSAYQDRALTSIEALSADEYQGWLTLSEVFYDDLVNRDDKQAALDSYGQEWDGGTYQEQLETMRLQLEQAEPKPRRMEPQSAMAGEKAGQSEDVVVDNLAGAAPKIEIFRPAAVLPLQPSAPVSLIVDAEIERDREPRYPSRALKRGVEASVTISMDIGPDGKVKDARIIQAATGRYARDFGISALRAAKRTTFTPKTIDGVAAPTNGYTRKYTFEVEAE